MKDVMVEGRQEEGKEERVKLREREINIAESRTETLGQDCWE